MRLLDIQIMSYWDHETLTMRQCVTGTRRRWDQKTTWPWDHVTMWHIGYMPQTMRLRNYDHEPTWHRDSETVRSEDHKTMRPWYPEYETLCYRDHETVTMWHTDYGIWDHVIYRPWDYETMTMRHKDYMTYRLCDIETMWHWDQKIMWYKGYMIQRPYNTVTMRHKDYMTYRP